MLVLVALFFVVRKWKSGKENADGRESGRGHYQPVGSERLIGDDDEDDDENDTE